MGRQVLEQLLRHLAGVAQIERMPDIEGRAMTMILAPSKSIASGSA
jgi:translation initiation factor IF-3